MPLEDCPECGAQVSNLARACPSCGFPRASSAPWRVIVTDFKMDFSSLVSLFIKMAFAAIPAMIVIWVIFMIIGGIGAALFLR